MASLIFFVIFWAEKWLSSLVWDLLSYRCRVFFVGWLVFNSFPLAVMVVSLLLFLHRPSVSHSRGSAHDTNGSLAIFATFALLVNPMFVSYPDWTHRMVWIFLFLGAFACFFPSSSRAGGIRFSLFTLWL